MRAVNLLPRDAERVRADGARTPLLVAAGGVAIVTAAAVMISISASGVASDRRAELAAIDDAVGLVQNAGPPAVTQAALNQERTDRVAALAASLQTRVPFDRLLRELSLVLPEDAWLTGVTASAPALTTLAPSGATPPASAATTQGVTIQGATYSHESVARVLARLSVIPSLEGVRLTASARVEPPEEIEAAGVKKKKKKKRVTVVAFTVVATLPTGGSS